MSAAGIYLIYIAVSLIGERHTESAMPVWAIYLFSGFFGLAALAIFVYAFRLWKRAKEEEKALMERIALEESMESASCSCEESVTDDSAPIPESKE